MKLASYTENTDIAGSWSKKSKTEEHNIFYLEHWTSCIKAYFLFGIAELKIVKNWRQSIVKAVAGWC